MLEDRVEVAGLVAGGVGVAGGLVRGAPAQEVEGHQPASDELGHEPVVEVQVVGEAVHEHDRGLLTRILAGVQLVATARDPVLKVGGSAGLSCLDGTRVAVGFHRSSS